MSDDAPEVLACGHPPKGVGTGIAYDVKNDRQVCYACAADQHRQEILNLEIGQNHCAYVSFAPPYGHAELKPGIPGVITAWSGDVLGEIVPRTLSVQNSTGFWQSKTVHYHFRAIVSGIHPEDFVRSVLVYGRVSGNGELATLKRMIDRKDPAGDPPGSATRARTERIAAAHRRLKRATPTRVAGFDYEETGEL